jgi:hypothetical protein
MSGITYKNLYSQIISEIEKRVSFNNKSPYQSQTTGKTNVDYSNAANATTAELISAVQNLLAETIQPIILEGLIVTATNPNSNSVVVSSGSGSAGGVLFNLSQNFELIVDLSNPIYYVLLDKDGIKLSTTYDLKKLTIAKIVVPNPGVTSLIQDNKDNSWNAYIVNFTEYKLYGFNDKFEEDTIELLRDNISPILADNLIGNIRLSEDLKIINTQGTLELNSESLKLLSTTNKTLAKFDRNGTFFYDDNGIEIARFTVNDAKIGNILVTKNSIGSANFISENSGFRIEDSGYAEFEDVRIRGKISSSIFEFDKISAVGGKVYIGNASVLSNDISATDTTITVDDSVFNINEVLTIKSGINQEWMLVTDVSLAPIYTVTRDLANAYSTNPTWSKGTAIVSSGTTNSGFISLDAVSNYSPFIDINLRNSMTYNDWTTKVRLGNLVGITDSLYGTLSGYGLYSDNVYLKGKLYAPDIKTSISGSRIELNTDYFRAYDNSGLKAFQILLTSESGVGDEGDIIIGDISGDHLIWDASTGELSFTGTGGGGDFISNIIFTATDYNTASWSSGNLVFSDGNIRNIIAGNTGNITSTTYIYFDSSVSETILQTTTTFSDTVGKTKNFLAAIEEAESNQNQVTINLNRFKGTTISGNSITTGIINANRIAAASITGDKIVAQAITSDKINVTQLDAIAINTGSLTIDEAINVGTGGKVVLDGANKIIKVYDDSSNLRVEIGLLS